MNNYRSGLFAPSRTWRDGKGKAYLAASNSVNKWYAYLFRMTPDGTQLLDADFDYLKQKNVNHEYEKGGGTIIPGYHSSEGNKIYKRNGYFTFFISRF